MAEKRKTKTSSAVKNRYNNRVYGSIIVRIPKEMAEAFKEKCAVTGTAQAQVIKKAIENNEAVESVVIKITLKKQKSDKASNPKESK